MKQGKTDITILLDRSGSMESVRDSTIDSFNEFVSGQKQLSGEADITLIQFDSADRQERIYSGPLTNAPKLTRETFVPRGGTPLHDAMGLAIVQAGERLKSTSEDERPEHVIVMILTDGQENESKEYSHGQVAQMVKHQQEKYHWDFVFLGANQDAVLTARGFNIAGASALSYNANPTSVRSSMRAATGYFKSVRAGATAAFTDTDRKSAKQ